MNAAGQMHDVTTMVHEGGHAVHSFLAHPLELNGFKEYPMEMARSGQYGHGAVQHAALGRLF